MSKTFDPQQLEVLESSAKNQLVSAGAGSGKTTVMINKIADLLISKSLKPNEIIVLTFTNLAGAEMRTRLNELIEKKLEEITDKNLIEDLSNLLKDIATANIDTIDGFCSKMCKKYFYKLGLSPETAIATGFTLDYYLEKALNTTITNNLENNREATINLADCFEENARNLDSLKQNLVLAFHFVMVQKDYNLFLDNAILEYSGLSKSCEYLNNYLINNIHKNIVEINYYIDNIRQCTNIFTSLQNYLDKIKNINQKNTLFENLKLIIDLPKVIFSKTKDEFKSDVTMIKKYFLKIKTCVENFTPLTFLDEKNLKNKHFETFIKLLKDFIENYQLLKLEHKVQDFTDLERQMLALLQMEDVKNEFDQQYKYIFVDEYQDINPMQDEIINNLKNINTKLFFVGDVKQSIYGFRQSTPELFLDLYKKYQNENEGKAFNMNINFRSNPTILNFNNEIFTKLMNEEKTDIDYASQKFEPKRTDFPCKNDDVEIAIFNQDKEEANYVSGVYSVKNDTNYSKKISGQSECYYIIDKIQSLIGTEFYDSSIKSHRPITYKDIAILSRSLNDSKIKLLINLFKEYNIPISINNKISLNDSESLNIILNILKVISNVQDDVAMLNVCKTSLGELDFDEIFTISRSEEKLDFYQKLIKYIENNDNKLSFKIKKMFNLLENIKNDSYTTNNVELINIILNKYHIKQFILNSANGEAEITTLTNFINTISERENNLSLESFINFIKTNLNHKTEYNQTDQIDAITIQTIHASKGLEYPIVILFNCAKTFQPNNASDNINFDTDFGIGMHYFNLEKRTKHASIVRFAITLKNKIKMYKEEMRLLYVATTRAKNKLILTGAMKFSNIEKGVLSDSNYIENIYSVFSDKLTSNAQDFTLTNCILHLFDDYNKPGVVSVAQEKSNFNIDNAKITFKYPYKELTEISLKNTVTAISKQQNTGYNILPKKLNVSENLEAITPIDADLGTLYHKILSNINFSEPYQKTEETVIDNELIKLAYDKISHYTVGAKNILQEQQFMMYLPYNVINPESKIEEKVLVQGVVDLIIEFDEYCILFDYKLSNSNIQTLKTRYSTQLKLYSLAIKKALNKKVKSSFIYKINSGEII